MKKLFLVLLLVATTSSCATMFSGSRQMLTVQSQPSGAKGYLNDEFKGTTPVSFEIERRLNNHKLSLRKDGFSDLHADGLRPRRQLPTRQPRRTPPGAADGKQLRAHLVVGP